jgi:oligosaccharide repeat unit polymerase
MNSGVTHWEKPIRSASSTIPDVADDASSPSGSRYLVLVFKIFILLSMLFVCLAGLMYVRNESEFLILLLTVVSTLTLSIPVFFRRDYSLFEPMTFVIMVFMFGAPFKVCYVLANSDAMYVVERLLNYESTTALLYGLGIVLLSLISLVAGYMMRLGVGKLSVLYLPQIKRWNSVRLQVVLILLLLVSLASLVGFFALAGVRFTSFDDFSAKRFSEEEGSGAARVFELKYYLYRIAAFSKFVAYLGLAWLYTSRRKWLSLTGLFVLWSILQTMFLATAMSNRAGVVLLLIDCMVLTYFLKKQIRLSSILIGFGVCLALLIPMLASRDKSDHTIFDIVEKSMLGRDMMDVTKTCHIINAVPNKMEYRNGEMLYGWACSIIPKSIWPDRPLWVERGPMIHQQVYGLKGGIAGCPPGLIAELYWNFGVVGTLIGMFLVGMIFRAIFVAFRPVAENPTSVLLYTILVTRFVMFSLGNDWGTGIVKAGLDLVPLLLILAVVGVWQRPTPRKGPVKEQ